MCNAHNISCDHYTEFHQKRIIYNGDVDVFEEREQRDARFVALLDSADGEFEGESLHRRVVRAAGGDEQQRSHKKMLVDQVVAQNPMDVPESMVASYLEGVVKDFKQNKPDADENEIREKYHPVGVNAVKWYLLFHRLALQEKIEVSKEDTEKWIERFAENYRMEVAQAKEILAKTGKADEINHRSMP